MLQQCSRILIVVNYTYTVKNAQNHLYHNLFNYSTYISCIEKKTLIGNYLRCGAYKNT